MKTGIDEIKKFMSTDITDTERMTIFLSQLSDYNEYMKLQ